MALCRKRPVAHSWHVPLTPVPASPASQLWHTALPGSAFSPRPHPVHVLASGSGANVFLRHSLHSSRPSRLLARPGMHGRHDAELLPACENPAGHSRHVDALLSLPPRYCPARHSAQGVPALPASQEVQAALPGLGAYCPVPQLSHVCASCSPAKVSVAHGVHADCPSRCWAVPGMHGRHDAEPLAGW